MSQPDATTDRLTAADLDRLEALATGATAGPLVAVELTRGHAVIYGPKNENVASAMMPDAAYLAAAANAVPGLVAEVRRLSAERDGYLEIVREYARHDEGCSAEHGDKYRCRCGWREVSKTLPEVPHPHAGPDFFAHLNDGGPR